jgi:hypothetical protein
MSGPRRTVVLSNEFLERAQALFPVGGSAEGPPSWDLFHVTVLKAAVTAFANDFEGQHGDSPGSPIRIVLTAATPFFPSPLAFYAVLSDADTVMIMDVTEDDDWLQTWEDSDD